MAQAELEEARDLMEAGKFMEARAALWPAARSGNAEAEELIGIMYAMGLGVEQDYERAFEWYLRAAMKGHPGAQSGVAWYYEVGAASKRKSLHCLVWSRYGGPQCERLGPGDEYSLTRSFWFAATLARISALYPTQ